MGIMESCQLAANSMGFSCEAMTRWAKEIYAEFFGSLTLEYATDNLLEMELESARGKHPKWFSLIADENVKAAVKTYIQENGYQKGKPNLTIADVVSWLKAQYGIEVSKTSVCRCFTNWVFPMCSTPKAYILMAMRGPMSCQLGCLPEHAAQPRQEGMVLLLSFTCASDSFCHSCVS